MWYILWSEGLVMVQNLLDAEEYIWFEILSSIKPQYNRMSVAWGECFGRKSFYLNQYARQ